MGTNLSVESTSNLTESIRTANNKTALNFIFFDSSQSELYVFASHNFFCFFVVTPYLHHLDGLLKIEIRKKKENGDLLY